MVVLIITEKVVKKQSGKMEEMYCDNLFDDFVSDNKKELMEEFCEVYEELWQEFKKERFGWWRKQRW